jgi:transcription elongation factor Elf1
VETRLCPRCGAYWNCDCQIEELAMPVDPACEHDWVDAVGVEIDIDVIDKDASVVVCRLCGLYAVKVSP